MSGDCYSMTTLMYNKLYVRDTANIVIIIMIVIMMIRIIIMLPNFNISKETPMLDIFPRRGDVT